jgi:hypothetical protein
VHARLDLGLHAALDRLADVVARSARDRERARNA